MPASFIYVVLFLSGTFFGSFLNVVTLRFKPEKGLFSTVGGRSHCPLCHKQLCWYELLPIVSFILQGAKCRSCRKKLSWQYPLVEILSGLVFLLIPLKFFSQPAVFNPVFPENLLLTIIWIAAFLALITLSIIDLRLQIIPDSLNVFLVFLGLAQIAVLYYFHNFGLASGVIAGSFLGRYALIFWLGQSLWLNFALGAALGLSLFAVLYILTRGRGMGLGDVKFGLALGLLFGWPDILFVSILAFILGSIVGIFLLARGKKKMKDSLAFGPFLALGAAMVFFFGYNILDAYFNLFGF